MTSAMDLTSLEKDPRLFLYTSLTAGSSHIITATSRLETILKANRIPFQAIDIATDPKARSLWQRRGAKKRLPGLVKDGYVIGDINEVEEWNEYGELRENIGPVPEGNIAPPGGQVGVNIAPPLSLHGGPTSSTEKLAQPISDNPKPERIALPAMAEIAALNKAKAEAAAAQIAKEREEARKISQQAEPGGSETAVSAACQTQLGVEASEAVAAKLAAKKAESSSHTTTANRESVTGPSENAEVAKAADPVEDETPEPTNSQVSNKNDTNLASEELSSNDKPTTIDHQSTAGKFTDNDEHSEHDKKKDVVEQDRDSVEATKGIEAIQIGGGVKTQEQSAGKAEDSAKSVED